jgi:hypothetical protein
MKIMLALAAVGIISSCTALLAETPVTPAEEEKIKAALESFGCAAARLRKRTRTTPCCTKSMTRSARVENTTSSSIRIST